MPNPRLLAFFGLALAGVAAFTGLTVWSRWDKHIGINGQFVKVRTAAPTAEDSLVILDLKLENPGDLAFQIDEATLTVTPASGDPVDGIIVAGRDTLRLFDAYPALGPRGNDPLLMRDIIGAHKTVERMMAFQFPGLPEDKLKARKSLVLKIHERQGSVHEIK